LRILAASRIPRYDLGRQNPSFLRWFCHTKNHLIDELRKGNKELLQLRHYLKEVQQGYA
jgi:hypothetical protein